MTEQEKKNRQFAKLLAELYYGTKGMENAPIILNSQQYEYFVEEWNKLNEKIDE